MRRFILLVVLVLFGCGKRQQQQQAKKPIDAKTVLAEVDKLARPSYVLGTGAPKPKLEWSYLGGTPLAPASFIWPSWNGRPQSFLGQIALKDLPKDNGSLLPKEGILYFFYDSDQGTWGFDPKDRGSAVVIHVPDAKPQKLIQHDFPKDLVPEARFKRQTLDFVPERCNPDPEGLGIIAPDLPTAVSEGYQELCMNEDAGPANIHRLLGYPAVIQNEMRVECALVNKGLYCGDASGYNDPRAKEVKKEAADWVLLLQLTSDEDIGMMWGDSGNLYFWIHKNDLKKADFSKCWMILQCY